MEHPHTLSSLYASHPHARTDVVGALELALVAEEEEGGHAGYLSFVYVRVGMVTMVMQALIHYPYTLTYVHMYTCTHTRIQTCEPNGPGRRPQVQRARTGQQVSEALQEGAALC